jgi:hypothetical protein
MYSHMLRSGIDAQLPLACSDKQVPSQYRSELSCFNNESGLRSTLCPKDIQHIAAVRYLLVSMSVRLIRMAVAKATACIESRQPS